MNIPYGTESIKEFIEDRKMAKEKKEDEEEKTYANPILYLHKSKKGGHLYAFNVPSKVEASAEGIKDPVEMVLGNNVESLILNVSDVSAVLEGQLKWAKVSVVLKEEG
jgi:hypothetical protein